MMEGIPPSLNGILISVVFGVLGSIVGIIVTSLKVRSDFFKEVKEFYDREIGSVRKEIQILHDNIHGLEVRFEKKIEKDLLNMKEANESEIKNLRHTIEQLRDEVRNSHSKLIDLLTSMISKSS